MHFPRFFAGFFIATLAPGSAMRVSRMTCMPVRAAPVGMHAVRDVGPLSLSASCCALLLGLQLMTAVPCNAVELAPCPKGANNCYSTASKDKTQISFWKWPAGMSRSEAVGSLKKSLASYPQEGQDGVDLGGWTIAEDNFDTSGYARLEFKSGIGNIARFMNGGKPFIDDFEMSVGDSSVGIRSSSRIGDSDLGVNAKRINAIASKLRLEGWEAPGV